MVGLVVAFGASAFGVAALSLLLSPLPAGHEHRLPSGNAIRVLEVDAASLELGRVSLGVASLHHSFVVRNSTSTPVVVTHISTDCTCTKVTPRSMTVPAKGDQRVMIEFDSSRVLGRGISRTERELMVDVEMHYADGQAQKFTLTGVIAVPWIVADNPIVIPTMRYGQEVASSRITVWVDSQTSALQISVNPQDGVVHQIETPSATTPAIFELRPSSIRNLGRFAFDLTVASSSSDGKELPSSAIRVVGRVESDIVWSPEDVTLIGGQNTATVGETITFWSRSGQEIEVIDVASAPDFIDVVLPVADSSHHVVQHTTQTAVVLRNRLLAPSILGASGVVMLRVRAGREGDILHTPIRVTYQSGNSLPHATDELLDARE